MMLTLCIYLVGGSCFKKWSNKLHVGGGIVIHSGLITGIFYFMTILLSSRYPFYWKWGLFMIGFDRQMIYHRKCAYIAGLCCIFHIIDHCESMMTERAMTGWICYGAAVLLLIFANNYFRRNHYNGLFLQSHWLLIMLFLGFGWLHNAILIQYGTFFIVLDALIRVFDHRIRSSKITNIRFLDYDRVIKLSFEKNHFKYRAGTVQQVHVDYVSVIMVSLSDIKDLFKCSKSRHIPFGDIAFKLALT